MVCVNLLRVEKCIFNKLEVIFDLMWVLLVIGYVLKVEC